MSIISKIMAASANQWRQRAEAAEARVAELETALRSIAANTCCDKCQEAALLARQALSAQPDPVRDQPLDLEADAKGYAADKALREAERAVVEAVMAYWRSPSGSYPVALCEAELCKACDNLAKLQEKG